MATVPHVPATPSPSLDDDACYAAVLGRDARFDGRFFTGVRTTGIYCRPSCPARTPARRNVTFLTCAAAAEEAGFRPCKRCRPDAAPHSPAWQGTSSLVGRALRLIAEGALDGARLPALAGRLGVGERHLTRLFSEHLGASPGAIARTRRAHFARQLIDQTDLPMGDVATAAGFSSLRRFNAAMQATFGDAPSSLRRTRARAAQDAFLELQLPFRAPLDWTALLDWLRARAIPGVEDVSDGAYRRTIACEDGAATLEVRLAAGSDAVLLRTTAGARDLARVAERVRDVLDLRADPAAIAQHLGRCAVLRPLVGARPGLRVPGAWDGLETSVRAVLGQQVSVAAATTLSGRIAAAFGRPLAEPSGALRTLFPTAEVLATADLGGLGVTSARAETIRRLARGVRDGRLDLRPSADWARTREALLATPGIGPWTAEVIALRVLRDPDAFPASDLGLRQAAERLDIPPTAVRLTERAEPWRPWRAHAAMHLWRSLT